MCERGVNTAALEYAARNEPSVREANPPRQSAQEGGRASRAGRCGGDGDGAEKGTCRCAAGGAHLAVGFRVGVLHQRNAASIKKDAWQLNAHITAERPQRGGRRSREYR